MTNHARDGGLAVGPGDRNYRNATRRLRRKQRIDDRLAHVARHTNRGVVMHSKTWRRVHFDQASARDWRGDVGYYEIDSAHVETNQSRRAFTHACNGRMYFVGNIVCRSPGG